MAHGMAMICGAAMIMLAAISGVLYLLSSDRLKKNPVKAIGIFPSIQKLERYNVFGLKAAFILITIGLVSGIGGARMSMESLDKPLSELLFDSKTMGIGIVWLLLGLILAARRLQIIRERQTAWISVVAFIFVVFAFAGSAIFCASTHDFAAPTDGMTGEIEGHK